MNRSKCALHIYPLGADLRLICIDLNIIIEGKLKGPSKQVGRLVYINVPSEPVLVTGAASLIAVFGLIKMDEMFIVSWLICKNVQ